MQRVFGRWRGEGPLDDDVAESGRKRGGARGARRAKMSGKHVDASGRSFAMDVNRGGRSRTGTLR